MKVKSESEVAQSCPTRSDPMDCSLPGSFIHGIFQARVGWSGVPLPSLSQNKNTLVSVPHFRYISAPQKQPLLPLLLFFNLIFLLYCGIVDL